MKIFVSAVTDQFKECRDALASDLRAMGNEVCVQEDFRLGPHTLLERLEEYVAGCDRVIVIVGESYGAEAVRPPEATGAPDGRSYSQWEYWIASGERLSGHAFPKIDTYLYFASEVYLRAHPVQQSEEHAANQRRYVAELRASGKHWREFDTADHLCRYVLRDGWQMNQRPVRPHNVPEPLGSLFKGREDYLRTIHDKFIEAREASTSGAPPARPSRRKAIHGQGGVGKTRLAIEYAWRYQNEYTALLFVAADSKENLHLSLAKLVGPFVLNLTSARGRPEEEQLAQALDWLRDHPGWFLILDNVDNDQAAQAVLEILPQLSGGDILITSRLRHWRPGVEKLELDVLAPSDSLDLFEELLLVSDPDRVPDSKEESVALLHDLGGLAVSIEHAAAYIAYVGCPVAEFHRRLRIRDEHVREWHDPMLMSYPRSVAAMWDTTLEWLRSAFPESVILLRELSWFATEPAPLWLFQSAEAEELFLAACRRTSPDTFRSSAPHLLERARSKLEAFSLLRISSEEGTSTRSVHPLVQEITNGQIALEERDLYLESATAWVNALCPAEGDDFRTFGKWQLLQPHAQALVRAFDPKRVKIPEVAILSEKLGELLFTKNYVEESEWYHRLGIEIETNRGEPENKTVAECMNSCAISVQDDPARTEEAKQMFRSALALMEKNYGRDHAEYGTVLANLANRVGNDGSITEAEEMILEALPLIEGGTGSYGPDHMDTLRFRAIYCHIIALKGDGITAEKLYAELLGDRTRALGEDHPDTISTMATVAEYLEDRGDYQGAEKYLQKVLESRSRVLGADHEDTVDATSSLANYYFRIDDCAKAETLFQKAIAANNEKHGPNHYLTLGTVNRLAVYYLKSGDYNRAEPLLASCAEGFKRVRGADHPATLTIINNLGFLDLHRGKFKEAEDLYQIAIEAKQRVFGKDHVKTTLAMKELSSLYWKAGRLDDCIEVYRQIVELRHSRYGQSHIYSINAGLTLASYLRSNRQVEEARALYESIARNCEEVYGPEHIYALDTAQCLAGFHFMVDEFETAESLYRRVLAGKRRLQGERHPATLSIMGQLAGNLKEMGKTEEALSLMRSRLAVYEEAQGLTNHDTLYVLEALADMLEDLGELEESLKCREAFVERMVGKRDSAGMLSLRRMALQYFIRGDYPKAEDLLRTVLGRNFERSSNCCHLARLLLMQDRIEEAREHVALAWDSRHEAAAYVVPRIHFLKALFAVLDNCDPGADIADMKRLLGREAAFSEWKILPALEHLRSIGRISDYGFGFFGQWAKALGERKTIAALDSLPDWAPPLEHV